MSEFKTTLADRKGLGRIHLCECNSVHMSIGPVTVRLAPEVFAQAAIMIREAMEQLAEIAGRGRLEEAGKKMPSPVLH